MIKKNKIPTILGVIILLSGVFAGVFFLGMKQVFRIGADSSVSPKDIRVSNLSDNSGAISWTTDKQTAGFVIWGEGNSSPGNIEKESQTDEKFFNHSVTLSGLKPNTAYSYKINSEGTSFDNKGIPWQFTTGPTLEINKNTIVSSGSVITASGQPEKRALIYINIGGYLLSTLTSDAGTFVFQLGNARSQDLQNIAQIDSASTLMEVSVQAGTDGVASAQIYPQSSNPIPPIIIGQVYDFRNLKPSDNNQVPNANLNLPGNITKESKFSIPITVGTPSPTSVILESLKEGEIVTSTKPAFFGRGPGGEKITVTIQSNAITQSFNIAKDGTWTWSPVQDLEPGAHTITISWVDAAGITRTLTRNFIVQASELPAFVATPSQTLSPSSSPASTPKSIASPKPTAVATASAEPVPVTGNFTPTLLLSIIGVVVMLFGFTVWKFAEN